MAKKPAKGLVVPKGKAVANIDAELEAEAANIASQIGSAETQNISTKDKQFTLPTGLVIQDTLSIVILGFVSRNGFYPGKYNSNDPKPPECYAISVTPKDMVPSKNSLDIQAKSCDACPLNEFGSDGEGKACKNTRMLAVMLASDDPVSGAIYALSVSPTALKNFDGYVNSISQLFSAPPIKVITEVMFHPEKDYPSLMFGNPMPNEMYATHFGRRAEATLLLEAEFDYGSMAATKPAKKKARRR